MKCVTELLIGLQGEMNSKLMDFQSFQDTSCLIKNPWISNKHISELLVLGPEVKCLKNELIDFQKNTAARNVLGTASEFWGSLPQK
jgi:hypothetical protein